MLISPKIIPEPRCLNHIQAGVAKGRYKEATDVFTDISLVFWNALFYNEAGSQIALDAESLKVRGMPECPIQWCCNYGLECFGDRVEKAECFALNAQFAATIVSAEGARVGGTTVDGRCQGGGDLGSPDPCTTHPCTCACGTNPSNRRCAYHSTVTAKSRSPNSQHEPDTAQAGATSAKVCAAAFDARY